MSTDRLPHEPRKAHIARLLRDRIQSGQLEPGQMLPSEQALVQQYGVARETVREAVAILRNEGLIVTRPQEGSYVRKVTNEKIVVHIDGETDVTTRMPTVEERDEMHIALGVPVFVVSPPGEEEKDLVLPGDKYVIRGPKRST